MVKLVICTIILSCICESFSHVIKPKLPKLLLISFDGFRYDYIDKAEAKKKNVTEFRKMMSNGVHAKYVKGVFTSVTFPSHTSIVSGMYEESHGIVDNVFHDPVFNDTFNKRVLENNLDPKWWNNGYEPIWITNERQGHDSAVINFPGMSTRYNGYIETFSNFLYNPNAPWSYYVDLMIGWLEREHTTLGILYHPEPDGTGHKYGPNSPEILDQIEKANGRLSYVMQRVKASYKLKNNLNVMLVSDHGMAELSKNRSININSMVPKSWYYNFSNQGYPIWGLWPVEGKEDEILSKLNGHPHLKAWKKEDVPEYFHYSHNRRIAPIVILAADRWQLRTADDTYYMKGTHGYNNSLADMHPIFLASGPAFKKGLTVPVVHMVDYYNLMCKILGLKPHPNNGSLPRVLELLDDHDDDGPMSSTFLTYVLITLPVALISAVFSLAAVQQIRYHYLRGFRGNRVELKQWSANNKEQLSALLKEDDSLSDEDLLNHARPS